MTTSMSKVSLPKKSGTEVSSRLQAGLKLAHDNKQDQAQLTMTSRTKDSTRLQTELELADNEAGLKKLTMTSRTKDSTRSQIGLKLANDDKQD